MKLIAKIDFNLNGTLYNRGDEVKVNSKEQLIKLNERGFIEPLTQKQIQNYGKEEKTTKLKKESFDSIDKIKEKEEE